MNSKLEKKKEGKSLYSGKRKRQSGNDRICANCKINIGKDGPRPGDWDSHLDQTDGTTYVFFETCSKQCRQAQGLPERKVT